MTRPRAALLVAAFLLAALLYLSRPRRETLHIPGVGAVQLATAAERERWRRCYDRLEAHNGSR